MGQAYSFGPCLAQDCWASLPPGANSPFGSWAPLSVALPSFSLAVRLAALNLPLILAAALPSVVALEKLPLLLAAALPSLGLVALEELLASLESAILVREPLALTLPLAATTCRWIGYCHQKLGHERALGQSSEKALGQLPEQPPPQQKSQDKLECIGSTCV